MPTFTIRSFNETDTDRLVQLWKDCGLVVPQNDPCKDISRKLSVNPDWLFVGELNGRVVASCMVGYEGHRGWINYLAVHPDYQRKGYARKLMERAELILEKRDVPRSIFRCEAPTQK